MTLRIGNIVALRRTAARGTIIDHEAFDEIGRGAPANQPWLVEWDDFSSSWHHDRELAILSPGE